MSTLPTGTALSRFIMCLCKARGVSSTAAEYAAAFRDTPHVQAAFESYRGHFVGKAGVPAATTTDSTWAEPLRQSGIADEFLSLARGVSIVGAMEARMRRVPFYMAVPRQNSTGTAGGWVAEGAAAPVVLYAYDTITLVSHKIGKQLVVTDALLRFGNPNTERLIRESAVVEHTQLLDQQFLDPTVTATAANPASITANATEITSTGDTATAITADLGSLTNAIETSGRALVWITTPKILTRIAQVLGAAASDVPRTLFGLPIIISANSPNQITLADAAEILYADEGDTEVSVSREATIEMLDSPTNNSATATPTTLVSMFQSNSAALNIIRWVNWEVARDGAVSFMEYLTAGARTNAYRP